MRHKVSLVIPCLNEEATIARAIRAARHTSDEVIVVDNGSSDRSRECAEAAGARVVRCAERGYGSALRAGFAAARHEYVAMADADLSYPFEELPKLIALLNAGSDLALGNRLRGPIERGAMPFLNRYFGTPVLSFFVRRLHGIPVYDCNGGMRAIRRAQIEALDLRSSGMELASEMLVRAGQLGLRYAETPISFARDQRGRKPHLRRWRDGWRHLRLIVSAYSSERVRPRNTQTSPM